MFPNQRIYPLAPAESADDDAAGPGILLIMQYDRDNARDTGNIRSQIAGRYQYAGKIVGVHNYFRRGIILDNREGLFRWRCLNIWLISQRKRTMRAGQQKKNCYNELRIKSKNR